VHEDDRLMRRIAKQSDVTLRALADELAERNGSALASDQNRPDVAIRRSQWRQRQMVCRSDAPHFHRRDVDEDEHGLANSSEYAFRA
jgi:hypothetical protein